MTQELAVTLYLLIGAFVAIVLLAFFAWSLWREIADLEARMSMAEYDAVAQLNDIRTLRIDARADEKRIVVLEDGVKDLSGHADLVTQWINLATDKLAK